MKTLPSLLAQVGDAGRHDLGSLLIAGVMILGVFLLTAVVFGFFLVWLRAQAAGVRVTFVELIALRLRKVPLAIIVDSFIAATRAGVKMTLADLSTHYLAGGNVPMLVKAMVETREAGIPLSFDRACAIDLATKGTGKSVQQAVESALTPRTIECPDPATGQPAIEAVTADGVRLKAKALLTVRANLDRFIGGATEQTLLSRVREAVAYAVSCCLSAHEALENPGRISEAILRLGLDKNTAFEILSLKIEVIHSS